MACCYAIRLPLRSGVTCSELLTALSDWICAAPGNPFREISLADLSSPLELSAPPALLTAASAVVDEVAYTAVRLQNGSPLFPALPVAANMSFRLDMLVEERPEGRFFTLQQFCSPVDTAKSAQVPSILPSEVLWELAERGLLAADGGLPLQQTPLTWTPQLDKTLQLLRNGTVFSVRPLLFVREGHYALTPKLTAQLSRFAHILVLPGIHPALSGLGAGGVRLHYPRLGISRVVDLSAQATGEGLIHELIRLTAFSLPDGLPDVTQLSALSGERALPCTDYLCMNRRIADAIRFYRVKSGLTQTELAQKVGTTGLLISRLENNRPARVREDLVDAIEKALHLSKGEIRGCEGLSASPEAITALPAFCPMCGVKTRENANFCHGCGSKLI